MAIGEHKSYALESSKSCPASCSNRRQRVKIVGTGETIPMSARQGDLKRRPAKRRGCIAPPQRELRQRDWVPVRDPRHRRPWLSCQQTLARRLTLRSPSSRCAARRRANRWRISRYRRAVAGFQPRSRRGFLSTLRSCTCGWLRAFAKESPSAQTSMWPSHATSCLI